MTIALLRDFEHVESAVIGMRKVVADVREESGKTVRICQHIDLNPHRDAGRLRGDEGDRYQNFLRVDARSVHRRASHFHLHLFIERDSTLLHGHPIQG
jgi:hypothetical protein